ncbi:MAG TPA: hypothetical protein VGQ56_01860 [Gemmatimonadaceae bacterium]|nr:hypothetical protein [Gemmatimonadaceae bacterium]
MRNLVATTHTTVRTVKHPIRTRLSSAMSWLAVESNPTSIPR